MLLAKAPPAPISINLAPKPKPKPRFLESFASRHERGCRLVVRAGYTRTPMETPGAYQLVDDDTGEKFIVWGGSNDDLRDSLIPSKDVLSWSPSNAPAAIASSDKVERNSNSKDSRSIATSITSNCTDEGALFHLILLMLLFFLALCSMIQFLAPSPFFLECR